MTRNSKKHLAIVLSLVVVGLGIFLIRQRGGTTTGSSSSLAQDNLYPKQSITHGHGLAVDVQDPKKLYIATHHGLLVLLNERDLYRVGKSQDDYMGFSPHPTEATVFFSSGHPSFGGNIGFQRSDDGGTTWKKISQGVGGPVDFHAMTVSPVNPSLIYGWYQGNIQRSTDQGTTWEIVNRNVLAVYLAADPRDVNTVYAATPRGQGVMVSRDQGVSFVSLSPELEGGAVSVIAVHPQDANVLLAFAERLGGLGKSTDAGTTWRKVRETFNNETVLHITFSRNNPGVVYALTHENTLFKSTDAGGTWNQVR